MSSSRRSFPTRLRKSKRRCEISEGAHKIHASAPRAAILVAGLTNTDNYADMGYPSSVSIDFIENAIDDKMAFTVFSFQLPDASGI